MLKKYGKWFIFGFVLLGGFALYQFSSAGAQGEWANSNIVATPNSDEATVIEAIETSEELTAKWLESIGSGEWLFISSKSETGGNLGTDPETGFPIPNQSLWEGWYQLDSNGHQTTVLIRRTDLELGNVTYVVWQNGQLLRLPSGVKEETSERGGWATFRPIRDHFCNNNLSHFLEKPAEGNTQSVIIHDDASETGQWAVTMVYGHPSVSDVSGFSGSFVGAELTCTRNLETGAVESTEEYLISENGDRVLLGRDYDYEVMWVDAPPAEMLSMLDQLGIN